MMRIRRRTHCAVAFIDIWSQNKDSCKKIYENSQRSTLALLKAPGHMIASPMYRKSNRPKDGQNDSQENDKKETYRLVVV
jgi:hypothetical protein